MRIWRKSCGQVQVQSTIPFLGPMRIKQKRCCCVISCCYATENRDRLSPEYRYDSWPFDSINQDVAAATGFIHSVIYF